MILDKIFYNKIQNDKIKSSLGDMTYKKLDCKTLKKVLNSYSTLILKYNMYEDGTINNFLFSVDMALNNCEFTQVQLARLHMWFDGYTENEIAEVENVTRWVVSKSITAGCNKILIYLVKKGIS